MTKVKTAERQQNSRTNNNGSSKDFKAINGNHNGENKADDLNLGKLNKNYVAARTKKEKDEARKALTMATFNATYQSYRKRRS